MSNASDLQSRLASRAASDPTFRQQLLSDPNSAIQDELGLTVPAGINVKVVQDTADTAYVVLPAAQGASGQETGTKGITWSAQSNGCHC